MNIIKLRAAAKLNLSLAVTGLQENGYHSLLMLMQSVSLYDTITIEKQPHIYLTSNKKHLPLNPRNIVFKAALSFFEHNSLSAGANINLEKHIPIGAGMAGGSADAAAVLVGLNELYNTNMTTAQLCKLGAALGADVPFSILGGTALAAGIGDELTPIYSRLDCCFTILMPAYHTNTKYAFAAYDKLEIKPEIADTNILIKAIESGNVEILAQNIFNNLEATDTLRIQAPKQLLLQNGALSALMTGSGAAIYGIFQSKEVALAAGRVAAKQGYKVYITRPIQQGVYIKDFS